MKLQQLSQATSSNVASKAKLGAKILNLIASLSLVFFILGVSAPASAVESSKEYINLTEGLSGGITYDQDYWLSTYGIRMSYIHPYKVPNYTVYSNSFTAHGHRGFPEIDDREDNMMIWNGKGLSIKFYSKDGLTKQTKTSVFIFGDPSPSGGDVRIMARDINGNTIYDQYKSDVRDAAGSEYKISTADTGGVLIHELITFKHDVAFDLLSCIPACGAAAAVAPEANDDTVNTDNSQISVIIDVLANDTLDANIDILEILSSPVNTGASAEVVTVDGKQQIKYTIPADGASDSFSYKVTDVNGLTDTANVNVSIADVQVAPVANDDTGSVRNNTSVNVDVLANDALNAALDKLEIVTAPSNGSAVVSTVGGKQQIRYTPTSDFEGQDTLTYQVTDANGKADTALVTINVTTSDACRATFFGVILCNLPPIFCFFFGDICNPPPAIDIVGVNKAEGDNVSQITITGTVTADSVVTAQPTDNAGNATNSAPLSCTVTGTTFSCTGNVSPEDENIEATAEKNDKTDSDSAPIPKTEVIEPPAVEIIDVVKDDMGNLTVTGTVTEGSTVTGLPTDEDGDPSDTTPLICTVTGSTFSCSGPVNPGDKGVIIVAEKDDLTAMDDAPIPADEVINLTLDGVNRDGSTTAVTLTGTVTEGANVTAIPVNDNDDTPTGTSDLVCTVTGTTYECVGTVGDGDNRVKVQADKGNLESDPLYADITCIPAIGCIEVDPIVPPPRVTINQTTVSEGLFTLRGKVSFEPTSVTAFAIPQITGVPVTRCNIGTTADAGGLRTFQCFVPVTELQTSVSVQAVRTESGQTVTGPASSVDI